MSQWLQEITTLTCVHFIPRTTETDYINYQGKGGCWSYIGKVGGAQVVGVDRIYCMTQYVFQHEALHALGFIHEVQRKDREEHVDILYDNIAPEQQSQFDIINDNIPILSYDYNSVMHFDRFAYSKNRAPTILPIPNPNVTVGQWIGISPMDITKLNTFYKCNLCRSLLTGNNGTINSTNYPSPYPSNSNCLYLIRIPADRILVTFQAFDIASSANCSSDYLRVYDGLTTSSPVILDRACGRSLPYPLMSSSNVMLFEFVSDRAVSGAGFQASYTNVTCGGIYSNSSGTVTSPRYPRNTPQNMSCLYNIIAPPGYKIRVRFNNVFLGDVDNCDISGYSLSISDGSSTDAPLLQKLCGYVYDPPVITSTGNNMALQFVRDDYVTTAIFSLSYTFVPVGAST
ncbi:embryonic protein UVS.2-like [Hyperolius riggenbachi]|uniref:embryonic protein UVS.2-like n=1 Tax=Hyperolius riggenbachi TaxID=752182 RepID=UPI0035A32933